jgi:hypothetical protein
MELEMTGDNIFTLIIYLTFIYLNYLIFYLWLNSS